MWGPQLTNWRATPFPTPIPAQRQHSRGSLNSTRRACPSEVSVPRAKSHRLHIPAITLFSYPPRVRHRAAVPVCKQATLGRNRLTTPAPWLERQRRAPLAQSRKRPRRILSILIPSAAHPRSTLL